MDILSFPFFQNALAGVIIISIASAVIGTYIVTRRMVFISGGITHACFGGLGLGYFLGVSPMLMAAVFAVAGSFGVDVISRKGARNDSAIAVIWAVGMALGILFISLTPGYVPELSTFLFGNVLTISISDLILFGSFTALLIVYWILFGRLTVIVAFDADFAHTRRLPVRFVEITMIILAALCIVFAIRLIGIMLLMSLISLPQLVAERFTRRYAAMMALSAAVSLAGSVGGLWLAYLIDVPASATIVLLLAVFFIVASVIKRR